MAVKKNETQQKPAAAKKPVKKSPVKKKRVTFSLNAPGAGIVTLCGSFNNWDPSQGAMKKDSKGVWKKTVDLEPGVYEYKLLVDDDWIADPSCAETVPNPHGTMNSIIRV